MWRHTCPVLRGPGGATPLGYSPQFSGYKKPFVWHVTGATPSGRPLYQFVPASATRRSVNGKFGDFAFTITQPGLYKVGNTKDENGYRFVFQRDGVWRYRSIQAEADAIAVARRLQAGEAIDELTQDLIETFNWRLPYVHVEPRGTLNR